MLSDLVPSDMIVVGSSLCLIPHFLGGEERRLILHFSPDASAVHLHLFDTRLRTLAPIISFTNNAPWSYEELYMDLLLTVTAGGACTHPGSMKGKRNHVKDSAMMIGEGIRASSVKQSDPMGCLEEQSAIFGVSLHEPTRDMVVVDGYGRLCALQRCSNGSFTVRHLCTLENTPKIQCKVAVMEMLVCVAQAACVDVYSLLTGEKVEVSGNSGISQAQVRAALIYSRYAVQPQTTHSFVYSYIMYIICMC